MVASKKEPFKPTIYWVQIQRGLAYFIDLIIFMIPSMVARFKFGLDERPFVAVTFLILIIYFIYFEYKFGQTLGKKILGIKVFMDDGKQLTLKASIIRNLLKLFDGYIFGGWLTLILVYVTPKKQRLGDILAHTVVVKMY